MAHAANLERSYLEPFTLAKISFVRVISEGAAFAGISMLAFTITTQEVAIGVSICLAIVGAIVWLVRLEGRINTQTALLIEMGHRLDRISNRLGSKD
jgi:hypothetical protein